MPRSTGSAKKRRLNRSVKISTDIYERLVSLQGFLQLKERRKRSMDELLEFILSFVPSLEMKMRTRIITSFKVNPLSGGLRF